MLRGGRGTEGEEAGQRKWRNTPRSNPYGCPAATPGSTRDVVARGTGDNYRRHGKTQEEEKEEEEEEERGT